MCHGRVSGDISCYELLVFARSYDYVQFLSLEEFDMTDKSAENHLPQGLDLAGEVSTWILMNVGH